jgi:hypothetical protein
MNLKKYKEAKETALNKYNAEIKAIDWKYVLSNNNVKIGDTIRDHQHIGIVESFSVESGDRFSNNIPCVVYKCKRLTNELKPSEHNPIVYIYNFHLKEIIESCEVAASAGMIISKESTLPNQCSKLTVKEHEQYNTKKIERLNDEEIGLLQMCPNLDCFKCPIREKCEAFGPITCERVAKNAIKIEMETRKKND